MQIDQTSQKPIFLQIAESIEDAILSGAFPEESQIPSITELSVSYQINPATANKGINLLVDSGILYKKRGIGMFVATDSVESLLEKRREKFYLNYIENLVSEAKRLQIPLNEIVEMIKRGY